MGLFRTFGDAQEQRGWLNFDDVTFAPPTHAGVSVDQKSAVNLPAVYRCWSLNADTVESLPVDVYQKRGRDRVPAAEPWWLTEPNDDQDFGQFISQVQLSIEADGNAFILKAATPNGKLAGLYVLPPTAVQVEKDADTGRKFYVMTGATGREIYSDTEILHVRWLTPPGFLRGLSPITVARQTLGTGLAAEEFGARYFGSGATLSGVISHPGNISPEIAQQLKESFTRKHGGVSKSHAVGVLSGGATWTPISVNPEESQFLETRRFTDVQIANLYGIPAEYVTEAEGAKGYVTGIYARQYMWLLTGMNPRLVRLERALSSLLPPGNYLKFNRRAFLAMDPSDRVSYYSAGQMGQWLTVNEIRALEDMNPMSEGDRPLKSVQWQQEATA